jgi:hypothetical protein
MTSSDEELSEHQPESPQVIVSFSGYKPPFDPAPIVRRMLDSVPRNYLAGLSTVVLSDAGDLSAKRRDTHVKHRKRRVMLSTARGAYHPAYRGHPAWIEIFIDNTLRGWETGLWLRIPFIREWRLSDVLFHEIGHHIHHAVRPERREKEDVADVWKVRLDRNYARQRYRLIGVIVRMIRRFFGPQVERQRIRALSWEFRTGNISRAEYLERSKDRSEGPDAH